MLRGDSRITLCGSHGGVENMGIGSKYTCFRNTKAHLTLALELEKLDHGLFLSSQSWFAPGKLPALSKCGLALLEAQGERPGLPQPFFAVVQSLSRDGLLAAPWTVAHQVPLCVGFLRREHWSGLPYPSPGPVPNPGIEPGSPAYSLPLRPPGPPCPPLQGSL